MVVSLPWHVGMRSSLKIISAAGYPSASEIVSIFSSLCALSELINRYVNAAELIVD
jgi:hypothetical protein